MNTTDFISENKKIISKLKIAIVHDWFVSDGGGEKVTESLISIFPQAEIFSIVRFRDDKNNHFLDGQKVHTSFIQKFPKARTKYRSYLPFMPLAIEQFDLSGFDIIISSSHAVAKGVLTGPDQIHICYCHSPIRYAWDLQHQYMKESNVKGIKSAIARIILHYIRMWDSRTASGVDIFLANSSFIKRRIKKTYQRDSVVVYPPVNINNFSVENNKEDFYLTASRFVPYKKIPLIAEAFSKMPSRKLVIIGDGPDMEKVKKASNGANNIEILGYQPFNVLKDHMQRAKAFVFAAEEDFGIINVEVQACGTPVIAFGRGGARETVCGEGSEKTGIFFNEQTAESIQDAVQRFEDLPLRPSSVACRANAEKFSESLFHNRFQEVLLTALKNSDIPAFKDMFRTGAV